MASQSKSLPKHAALVGTLLTNLGIQLLTVVSGVLVARLLQPQGRGNLAAAQLWPGIFAALAWLGANYSFAIRSAKQPNEILGLARSASALAFMSSGVFISIGWILLPLLLPHGETGILELSRWYLLFIPVNVLISYLQALDQGAGRLKSFNITRHFLSVIYLILVGFYWLWDVRDVAWFIGALLAANTLTLVLRVYLTGWGCLLPNFNWGNLSAVVREGRLYLVSSVVYVTKDNIERLVLLFLLGSQQLGLYVVAVTASGLHTTLAKSVNVLILPRSGALERDHAARDTARIFRVMSVVSAVLSVAMAAMLPLLIPLLFGGSFKDSLVPAVLLVAAQYFSVQGSILDEGLRAQSRPAIGLLAGLISVAVFLGLAAVLAHRYGMVGIAEAAICGQVAYCFVLAFYLRWRFQTRLLPSTQDLRFIRENLGVAFARAVRGVAPNPTRT